MPAKKIETKEISCTTSVDARNYNLGGHLLVSLIIRT